MTDVACVGILVADIMVKPVDSMPKRGLLEKVDKIELHTGGNAMTAALNLKKMGLSSSVTGKIGCDSLGDFLLSQMQKYDIDCRNVSRSTNVQTSSSIAMLAKDGERTFFHCVGANGVFRMSDVDWSVIDDAKIVFVTGIYLLDDFDTYDLTEFLKKCKQLGKITAADVCWNSKDNWHIINSAMQYIDIFLPSIDEARMIAGKDSFEECANIFFSKGVKSVVIKSGKDGCYIQEGKSYPSFFLPCCKNVKAIDTTGAGDSFCSGFLAAVSRGKSFYDCARFANAAGAICVMSTGASTGMKSYNEVEQFMEQHS